MSLPVEKREEIQRKEGEKRQAERTLKLKREREEYEALQAKRQKLMEDVSNAKDVIRKPGPRNRDKKTMLKFVVWSLCGYDADRWHSYHGPLQKKFDSSYATQADANARVKYLFYVKNTLGLSMEEMENQDVAESITNGLLKLECRPDDSEQWTVSAIPSSAFAFLVNDEC